MLRTGVGTIDPPGDLGEATLDIELIMGLLGPTQNLTLYQVGGSNDTQIPSGFGTINQSCHVLMICVTVDELLSAFDSSFCELDGVSGEGMWQDLTLSLRADTFLRPHRLR